MLILLRATLQPNALTFEGALDCQFYKNLCLFGEEVLGTDFMVKCTAGVGREGAENRPQNCNNNNRITEKGGMGGKVS